MATIVASPLYTVSHLADTPRGTYTVSTLPYDPAHPDHQPIKYVNHQDMSLLLQLSSIDRLSIVAKVMSRITDPVHVAEATPSHMLIYKLRLRCYILALVPKAYRTAAHKASLRESLKDDAGYDVPTTDLDVQAIAGFTEAIEHFGSGRYRDGADAFNHADEIFGQVRFARWYNKTF